MSATSLTFGAPYWLWGSLALPALALLFWWAERRAARRLILLIRNPRLRAQLTGAASAARRRWRYALLLLGLAGLIGALAEPRLGYEEREIHRRGLDLIIIVDVSKSMLATDLAPNRLTRAKLAVQDLIRLLPGDRVGLVAFAGSAFLQVPLTIDYDAVLGAVNELDPDLIPFGGTNIGGAVDLALDAFGKAAAGNRAILLLSDGEPTTDSEQADGLQAATRAGEAGVRIFTIGFGTTDGSLIPLPGGRRGDFIRDEDGKIVRTRINETNLSEIARVSGGFYLHFTTGETVMRTIIDDGLSKLRAGDIDARLDRRPIERYQWPLGAALVFLSLAAIPGERRRFRAPAALGGIPVGARAMPVRRRTSTPAAVAALALAGWLAIVPADRAADAPTPPAGGSPAASDASDPDGPWALYRNRRYAEAYRAFSDLARAHPDQAALEFNAGASAYMGEQYEEALDAFGQALTSSDPDLRAKAHYNFANALFRHGLGQKDPQARIADWRNAIQHYDSTLAVGKRTDVKGAPDLLGLAGNATFNRDLVQKRLDEQLRQTPPPPKNGPGKNDRKNSSQPKKNQPSKPDKNQPGQSRDEQKPPQNSGQPSPSGQSPDQSDQSQPPQSSPGQENSGKKGRQSAPDQVDPQNPPPNPSPGDDQSGDSKSGSKPPDQSTLPKQEEPRKRGDFQSQGVGQNSASPSPNPGSSPGAAPTPADEVGKMSPAQASALLDSLRSEDTRVILNEDQRHNRDEAPAKDW